MRSALPTASAWYRFRSSSWYRADEAVAAQPHGDDGEPSASYWLAWPPYLALDPQDPHHWTRVLRRRFRSREAAMAFIDRTWPLAVDGQAVDAKYLD